MARWMIDAVIARALLPGDAGMIRTVANACRRGLLSERPQGLEGLAERGIHLRVDDRDGVHELTGSLVLSPQARYSSKRDQSFCMMGVNGPEGSQRVDFETVLSVAGTVLPEAVVQSLAGRHAAAVIDHPALRIDGLTAYQPHVNSRDSVPTGFGVFLPQLMTPLRERPTRGLFQRSPSS